MFVVASKVAAAMKIIVSAKSCPGQTLRSSLISHRGALNRTSASKNTHLRPNPNVAVNPLGSPGLFSYRSGMNSSERVKHRGISAQCTTNI